MTPPRLVKRSLIGIQFALLDFNLHQIVVPTKADDQIGTAFACEVKRIDRRTDLPERSHIFLLVLVNFGVASHVNPPRFRLSHNRDDHTSSHRLDPEALPMFSRAKASSTASLSAFSPAS